MRWTIIVFGLILLLPTCSRPPSGPTPGDLYDLFTERFREAETFERQGNRKAAIKIYIEAKEAVETLRADYPKSAYYDERDLARVKDILSRLRDEDRRGVEATIAGQEGPPPRAEPKMSGELYGSIRRGIMAKLGSEQTNDGLDRVKRVEPDVVDNTPTLVIHILTSSRMIEGMMLQEVKRHLKQTMRVIRVHLDELGDYEMYLFAGYKAIEGAGGYAEPVLMVEYRFTPADFAKVDWERLDEDEVQISEFATKTREP